MQKQGVRGWRTFSLTDALATFQAKQAAQADALKAVAEIQNANTATPLEGAALETFVNAYTKASAETELATATAAVPTAQAAIETAEAALLNARATNFSDAAIIAAFDNITNTTKMTDANIESALTQAKAAVGSDKAKYVADGTKIASDATTPEDGYVALYGNTAGNSFKTTADSTHTKFVGFAAKKADVAGTPGDALTVSTANTGGSSVQQKVVTFAVTVTDSSKLADSDDVSIILDNQLIKFEVADIASTPVLNVQGGVVLADLGVDTVEIAITDGTTITVTVTGKDADFGFGGLNIDAANDDADGTATGTMQGGGYQEATPNTQTFTLAADFNGTLDLGGAVHKVVDGQINTIADSGNNASINSVSQTGTTVTITGKTAGGAAAPLNVTVTPTPNAEDSYDGNDTVADGGDLLEVFTAKQLETFANEAAQNLAADVANKGDAVELVLSLRDALLDLTTAGGDMTATYTGATTLTALLDEITTDVFNETVEATAKTNAEAIVNNLTTNYNPASPTAEQTALKNALDAVKNRDTLNDAVTDTTAALGATDSGTVLNAAQGLADARQTLKDNISDAQQDKADAEAYLAELTEAVNTYTAAGEEVDAAREALEDLGVENLVELGTANTGGTLLGADLFLYSDATSDLTITRFEAEDKLYLGDTFTRVDVASTDNVTTKSVGSVNELEVFFKQVAGGVELYIEGEAFHGNATTGFEGTTITIAGVNAADLVLENGFLTIG